MVALASINKLFVIDKLTKKEKLLDSRVGGMGPQPLRSNIFLIFLWNPTITS